MSRAQRPRGVANEDVDFTLVGMARWRWAAERGTNSTASGVAQARGGDRPAKIDVKAAPRSVGLDVTKTGQGVVDAAHQAAAAFDPLQGLGLGYGRRPKDEQAHDHQRTETVRKHDITPPILKCVMFHTSQRAFLFLPKKRQRVGARGGFGPKAGSHRRAGRG